MPRGTPKRAQKEARPGYLFPSEAVARNVRAYRSIRGMTQADVAERMIELGLGWSAGTVGFVERYDRAVTVDEYLGLAVCFGVDVGALFDPTGPDGLGSFGLDFSGEGAGFMDAPVARNWSRRRTRVHFIGDGRFDISAIKEEDQ